MMNPKTIIIALLDELTENELITILAFITTIKKV